MRFKPQITVLTVALALATLSASVQLALGKKKEKLAGDAPQMDEQKRAVHALNPVQLDVARRARRHSCAPERSVGSPLRSTPESARAR